jgi:Uncharacterized protein conserved in bacteria
MKNNEANTFVFIASIIIGILISMNISFSRSSERVFLSTKQYQDAYNYKNKLYNDIVGLVEQYDKYSSKLEKYKNNEQSQEQVTDEIEEELRENEIITGKTPVEGQGIKISLNDASIEDVENAFDYQLRLVHNTDIIQVLNDLRNAGAEAISINGQRIVDSSEVYCSGPFLRVNGVKIAAEFNIYAIGNKEVIYNYMMSNENYLKTLMIRKINVKVEKTDKIQIPAYTDQPKLSFVKLK